MEQIIDAIMVGLGCVGVWGMIEAAGKVAARLDHETWSQRHCG